MGEDFEDSVDTSSFDDISTDTIDTSGFSDPVDVGSMMDDIPTEPIESFDVEPIDSSFETDLPTAEATHIDSLMDDAADTYSTEDVPSDTLDSSGLDPSDISSDMDDYEMDAGSDIADLMDEVAIESLEDTTMDFDDMNQTTDNNIESLMNEVDTTPDIGAETLDAKPEVANEGNASEIESLLNTEGVNPGELSDTLENISESISEASSETSDISALMDENDVDDSTKPKGSQELEAIMANEQAGIDAIVEAQQSSSPPIDPIDGGASNPPIDPIESLEDIGSSNEPVHLTQSDVEEFIENSSDKDALQNLRDGIESGDIQIDVDDATEGSGTSQDIPQDISEETPTATDLPNEINYDEVFEGLDDYDFDGIDYASDTERLDSSLENFDSSTWEGLSLDEQKAAMTDLADYIKDVIGFDKPPEIVYYNNPVDGDYGGYSPGSNTLEVNEYMLYNNEEAADTVAHELWHAYQHQRANNPQSAKDYQYQYGFDNYKRPEDDFVGYQDQLIEAEARAFAQQFKDRLNMKGRRV